MAPKRAVLLAVFSFLIFLAISAVSAFAVLSSDWTMSTVVSNPSDQVNENISGHTVIWQDYRNTAYGCPSVNNCLDGDIFVRQMPAGLEQKLTATPIGMDPDISGNIAVWRDWSTGRVIVHNLTTGVESNASTVGGTVQQITPSVSGNKVVWIDYRQSTDYGEVYMRDLSAPSDVALTQADPSLAAPQKDKRHPDIDGNIVVWEDWRNAYQDASGWWHNPDIYMKDLSTGVESPVCTDPSDQYAPVVSGHTVAWQDYRNGNWDIYMKNLDTGVETRVTNSTDDQTWPSLSGDMLVYKSSPPYSTTQSDVYMEKLSTGAVTNITSDAPLQKLPKVSGYSIVWLDNGAGNWDVKEIDDTVAPQITSVAPVGNLTATAATISAGYSDAGSGVNTASVSVTLDGTAVAGCSVTAAQVSCPVTGLAQGAHAIGVAAGDLAGNAATASGSFFVDTVAPAVGAVSPSGWLTAAGATVSAGYSDAGSGIDTASAAVTLDGAAVTGCPVTAAGVSCPLTGLADGHHTVSVSVKDMAGNTGSASGSFDVDTKPPGITLATAFNPVTDNIDINAGLSDPAPGSGINASSVAVRLNGSPVSGCTVSASNVSCAAGVTAPGSYSVEVDAADNAGNSASASRDLVVADTTAPVIIIVSPTGTEPGPAVTISANLSDPAPASGIDTASAKVSLDGQALAGCAVSATQVSCTTGYLADGGHSVSLSVADNAGNAAIANWTFTVAPGAPTIYNLQPPAAGSANNTHPAISADYFDGSGINVSSARVYVDGVDLTRLATVTPGSIVVTVPGSMMLAPGIHNARVTVSDVDGNPAEKNWQFTVTSPSLSLAMVNTYWATYQDYLNQTLSVDYRLSNPGNGACRTAQVVVALASNGVLVTEPLPMGLGDINVTASSSYTLRYLVPVGVTQFIATTYASCNDDGGATYWFAGPPPLT